MSYHVYITRAEFWAKNDGSEISVDEWLSLVDSDPELTFDEANGTGFAVLTEAKEPAWLAWSEGNVFANYPNRSLQRKMLKIAPKLGAILQGEDGERYETIEDFPASVRLPDRATEGRGRWPLYRRKEFVRNLIIYGLIAAVIVAANVFDWW